MNRIFLMFKRVLGNATLMSWASYFVQFGSVLFIFPLLIKVYTPLEQSFWWLINTVIGLALLTDSGFGAVLMRGVAYFNTGADYLPRNREEFEKKQNLLTFQPNVNKLADLLTTMKRVYAYLSIFMLAMLVVVGPVILWNVMKLSNHRIDFWIAYLLLIPYCITLIMTARWRSFLRGLGFIAKEARINTNLGLLRLTAFFVILSFSLSPLYLVICMLVEATIKYFFVRSLILKWFKNNDKTITNKNYFDREIFKSLWTATWKEGLIEWGNYLLSQGNSIIMAQTANLQLMANFLLTTRIISIVSSVSQITLFSNIPKIYNLAAKSDIHKMKITAAGYIFLGMAIMIVSFVLVVLFGNPALAWLNKESQLVPMGILIIMLLTQILDSHSTFHAGIYISTNHIPFVIPSLVSGIVILGGGFLILPKYGLAGIIMLKFLVQLAFSNWYSMVLSLRLLKWPLKDYLIELPVIGSRFIIEKVKSFFSGSTGTRN
jgi:O-antigen/teichoic acid export membrane protein